jgi:hypothetical protein
MKQKLDADLYYALTQVDIQRVHTTITIDDFDCITEDTRHIFYNNGDSKLSLLLLPAMKRKIQRNMKVEDSSTQKLVFIPSSSSADILVKACTRIIDTANQHLSQPQQDAFKHIKENIQSTLPKVFTYKPEQHHIDFACEQIAKIQEIEILWEENFLREILPLTNLLTLYKNGFYRPLVTLSKPLNPQRYSLIHLSVEKVREYLQKRMKRLKFNIFGRFTFPFRPEIYNGISNHVRIYAPEGLLIKDVNFDISHYERDNNECSPKNKSIYRCENLKRNLTKNKKEYFDDRCFYIQLEPEKSTILYDCKTHFTITFGLSDLLAVLSLLWWLTILSPALVRVLSRLTIVSPTIIGTVTSGNFVLILLGLSATFLVAIGIYAIDKKIVRHFITTHVILVYLVLALEFIFMY